LKRQGRRSDVKKREQQKKRSIAKANHMVRRLTDFEKPYFLSMFDWLATIFVIGAG
jgi:hypothetical protein